MLSLLPEWSIKMQYNIFCLSNRKMEAWDAEPVIAFNRFILFLLSITRPFKVGVKKQMQAELELLTDTFHTCL